jgi:hypothetical protein
MPEEFRFNDGEPFIFISYSSEDKDCVKEDVRVLNEHGVNIWYDVELIAGQDWFDAQVKPRILQCKAVLFYASESSIKSKPVLQELETVYSSGKKKPIIPIFLFPTSVTSIGDFIEETSHEITTDVIEIAYSIADKIGGNEVYIPRKLDDDTGDYYKKIIKALKHLVPTTFNLLPMTQRQGLSERKSVGASYFISNDRRYYICEYNGFAKAVAERDAVAHGVLIADTENIPESDGEYFVVTAASEVPKILIPDKRLLRADSSKGSIRTSIAGSYQYKLSAGLFNAQAEVIVSRLAKYTNLGLCTEYEMCIVNDGCATRHKDLLPNYEVETVVTVHKKVTGKSLEDATSALSRKDLFNYIADTVKRGINYDLTKPDALRKLSLLLQFDALVLNEDRNFNNVKFIRPRVRVGASNWDFAPASDFDSALFSCTADLSNLEDCPKPARPFYPTHSEQLEWLYSLSDDRLTLTPFDPSVLMHGVWSSESAIGKHEIEAYLNSISAGGIPLIK